MKTRRRMLYIFSALALVIGLAVGWDWTASTRGRLIARFNIWRGHYIVLAYGLPPPERPQYVHLLHERYGIEVRTVALCLISDSLRTYADSYDEVSVTAANRKFGHNIFKECWEAARSQWELKKATARKP